MDTTPTLSQATLELAIRPSVLKQKSSKTDQTTKHVHSSHQPAVRFRRKDADEVIISEAVYVSGIDQPVRVFETPEPADDSAAYYLTPITIMTALRQRAILSANSIALASKLTRSWRYITYDEYHERVVTMAKAFIQLGLERCHGVGILGATSPEWFIANLAAIFAGGISVALNVQHTSETCQQVAYDSKCNIILVSSEAQCSTIFDVKARLPDVKAIVQLPTDDSSRFRPEVHMWQELLEIGRECSDDVLEERILEQAPNLCCTLIYKIAPGGGRRGVMLSHDNLLWTACAVGQQLHLKYDRERIISFLPLCATYNQVFDIYVSILYGSTVHFVSRPDDAITGVLETIREVRPTVLMAVPFLYDRMFEQMSVDFKNDSWFRRRMTSWATIIGRRVHRRCIRGRASRPVFFCVANGLVFRHVRRRLGLDDARFCLAVGAPIANKTFHFFVNLCIPILGVYGKAETSGFHTLSMPLKYRFKSVGKAMPGCYVDVVNKDQYGNGEVCVKGRNVFMGYLRDPIETMLAFDSVQWYHTGDKGATDNDQFFYITGRVKDMLVTETGDKVAPRPIEDAVKSKLPCVSQCMVVGEGQRYMSLLMTLKTERDGDSVEFSDRLSSATTDWLRKIGCDGLTTVRDVRVNMNRKVTDAIQHAIDGVNGKATSKSERIERWTVLPKDFSVAGGELDPRNELNRRAVLEKYSQFIDSLYQNTERTD